MVTLDGRRLPHREQKGIDSALQYTFFSTALGHGGEPLSCSQPVVGGTLSTRRTLADLLVQGFNVSTEGLTHDPLLTGLQKHFAGKGENKEWARTFRSQLCWKAHTSAALQKRSLLEAYTEDQALLTGHMSEEDKAMEEMMKQVCGGGSNFFTRMRKQKQAEARKRAQQDAQRTSQVHRRTTDEANTDNTHDDTSTTGTTAQDTTGKGGQSRKCNKGKGKGGSFAPPERAVDARTSKAAKKGSRGKRAAHQHRNNLNLSKGSVGDNINSERDWSAPHQDTHDDRQKTASKEDDSRKDDSCRKRSSSDEDEVKARLKNTPLEGMKTHRDCARELGVKFPRSQRQERATYAKLSQLIEAYQVAPLPFAQPSPAQKREMLEADKRIEQRIRDMLAPESGSLPGNSVHLQILRDLLLATDEDGWTPLHMASYSAHAKLVEIVVETLLPLEQDEGDEDDKVLAGQEALLQEKSLPLDKKSLASCCSQVTSSGSSASAELVPEKSDPQEKISSNKSREEASRLVDEIVNAREWTRGHTAAEVCAIPGKRNEVEKMLEVYTALSKLRHFRLGRNNDGYSAVDYLRAAEQASSVHRPPSVVRNREGTTMKMNKSRDVVNLENVVGFLENSVLKRQEQTCANPKCSKTQGGSVKALSRCSRCQLSWYCGRECQAQHFREGGHKKECKKPGNLPAKVPFGLNPRTGAVRYF
ncbi:unnamed protein product [Amoebophrya sp. A25]|nr:unnamed protein product [Amoebophrya sp. A25]|eukprot:GSA25T00010463001.1